MMRFDELIRATQTNVSVFILFLSERGSGKLLRDLHA